MASWVDSVRADFPALQQKVNDRPLVYLDSAASALKPNKVIERLTKFYSFESSNVHRGAHSLSDHATSEFEKSREKVKTFINAQHDEEVIFVKGTTEGINLVAQSFCQNLNFGDEILLTEMEHHANLVPWQIVAEKYKLKIQFIPVTAVGDLDLTKLNELLTAKTKIVGVVHASNTLGTINDIHKIIHAAHQVGAKVLLDCAQSITQIPIDVKNLDCDFLTFSGHKLFGPFGVGVLYGKKELLENMPPYQGGGSMIKEVRLDKTTYNDLPFKFEAGTPAVAEVIGLRSAIEYVEGLGWDNIKNHEQTLFSYVLDKASKTPNLIRMGNPEKCIPILSFNLKGAHHSDVAQILNQYGIAVRAGHHCTQPLLRKFNLTGSVRASFSIYNTQQEVDQLFEALQKAEELLL